MKYLRVIAAVAKVAARFGWMKITGQKIPKD